SRHSNSRLLSATPRTGEGEKASETGDRNEAAIAACGPTVARAEGETYPARRVGDMSGPRPVLTQSPRDHAPVLFDLDGVLNIWNARPCVVKEAGAHWPKAPHQQ